MTKYAQNYMKLSVVVLTKNEENNITRCIRSVKRLLIKLPSNSGELIIIDDRSTDKTVHLAIQLGAKVHERSLNGNWADQRNFALTKTKGEWVLFVDADEVVSEDLAREIITKISRAAIEIKGFYFRRYDYIFGRLLTHGEIGSQRLLRLARRGSGTWMRAVHEFWAIKGEVYTMDNAIGHHPHQSLNEFISDVNTMAVIHARQNYDDGKRSSLAKILIWPTVKFIYNYLFKLGVLDGMQGFVVAIVMSFHSFLAWSNLWLIQVKKKN